MIEYKFKLLRNPNSGIMQLIEYEDRDGVVISNYPCGDEDKKVVEACRGLAKLLNKDNLEIAIKC